MEIMLKSKITPLNLVFLFESGEALQQELGGLLLIW